MKRPFSISRLLVGCLAALAVAAAAACSNTPSPSVAATVNGADITDEELAANIPLFSFLADLQGAVCGQTGPEPPVAAEQKAACNRQVLGSLIQESVLQAYATEHEIGVTQPQVDDAIAQITQGGTQEQVEAGLKEKGLTFEELEGLVRRLLLYTSVESAQAAENIDDKDLRRIYEDSKLDLSTINAKHILVKTKEQAKEILGQVTPENFGELAEKYSGDPGSASNGGDLGEVSAGTFVPEFAEAALAAEPGEIVGPVRSQFGYHIILLISKDTPTFEEAKATLIQGNDESAAAFQEWLQGQMETAQVTVNPRYGTWDPATSSVLPINSTATSTAPAGQSPSPVGESPAAEPAPAG